MAHKILLAEDSITIHKVIKITLADYSYQIKNVENASSLLRTLKGEFFDLLFLDFGLSEDKSGIDLALEIKKSYPKIKIIMLYGTFDIIEEGALKSAGVDGHIVKPFESVDFIGLLEGVLEQEVKEIPPLEGLPSEQSYSEDENDAWIMDSSVDNKGSQHLSLNEDPGVLEVDQAQSVNTFNQDLEEWVPDSPPMMVGEKKPEPMVNIPKVLKKDSLSPKLETKSDIAMPSDDDLGYPAEDDYSPSSKLIPSDSLAAAGGNDSGLESDLDLQDEKRPLEKEDYLVDLLRDEENSKELWSPDNIQPMSQAKDTEGISLGDKDKDLKVLYQKEVDQLINNLKKDWEKKIESYCQERIEAICWEIIPDLAENLIKKELASIKEKVMDKS